MLFRMLLHLYMLWHSKILKISDAFVMTHVNIETVNDDNFYQNTISWVFP